MPNQSDDGSGAHAHTLPGRGPLPDDATVEMLYGKDFAPGALVGEYVVEELRSRGGFAVVYRATHHVTRREAAVKVLRRDLASADTLRRFEREAETLRRLRHPHIVEFLDYGQLSTGQPYLVLEWLEGRTLAEELRSRGALSPPEAQVIIEELGAALAAAHAMGVVHRDIKAENVMALARGDWFTVKLLDFGIAKLTHSERRSDQTTTIGAVIGTPLNMAPEQILGEGADVRTDIYALGLLLFQLITGRLPFWGKTSVEVELLHVHSRPPLPSSLAPVSEQLDAVVMRCLEKQREARYPTVEALLEDLRAAVRPRARAGAGGPLAFGVHVEARIDEALDDPDDEVLDDIDAVLELAREALEAAHLTVALESGNALLFAVTLPAAASAQLEQRRELAEAVVALAQELDARPGRSPHVRVALTMHCAQVAIHAADPTRISGDLLRLADWTGKGTGIMATPAALADLDLSPLITPTS